MEWILSGKKLIENRSWETSYRGPLVLHVGMKPLEVEFLDNFHQRQLKKLPKDWKKSLDFGGYVGVCDLVDCTELVDSPWADCEGYNWILKNPRRVPFIPGKGELRLFEVPVEVESALAPYLGKKLVRKGMRA